MIKKERNISEEVERGLELLEFYDFLFFMSSGFLGSEVLTHSPIKLTRSFPKKVGHNS